MATPTRLNCGGCHFNGGGNAVKHGDLDSSLFYPTERIDVLDTSNDETAATAAWKTLQAESMPNVYILEGGVNNWIATFGDDDLTKRINPGAGDDQLCYIFDAALGDRYAAAEPDPHAAELEYTPKIKLELKRAPTSDGCG